MTIFLFEKEASFETKDLEMASFVTTNSEKEQSETILFERQLVKGTNETVSLFVKASFATINFEKELFETILFEIAYLSKETNETVSLFEKASFETTNSEKEQSKTIPSKIAYLLKVKMAKHFFLIACLELELSATILFVKMASPEMEKMVIYFSEFEYYLGLESFEIFFFAILSLEKEPY